MCLMHSQQKNAFRKPSTISRELNNSRAMIGMRATRDKKRLVVLGENDNVVRICNILQKMSLSKPYVIIPDVILPIVSSSVEMIGESELITFSPGHDNKRSMQNVANRQLYVADVLRSLELCFSQCDKIAVKLIRSLPGDKAQKTHFDFDTKLIHGRVHDLACYHYSVIIALEEETYLLISKNRRRVKIPVHSMICFRGDLAHAGAAYKNGNTRFFISASCDSFPVSTDVFLTK